MFTELTLKNFYLFCSVLLISACSSTNNNDDLDLSIALVITSANYIVMGNLTDSFKADNDPNTVQYVFIKNGESWVSDDGQVIYVNANEDIKQGQDKSEVLLAESARNRLVLLK